MNIINARAYFFHKITTMQKDIDIANKFSNHDNKINIIDLMI